jgi:hypothetical protein
VQIFRRVSTGLLAPLVLSGALRLFHLSRSSYWLDEMTSLDLVGQPGIRAAFSDNNPPLYHLILKLWVLLLGDGEWTTRVLSVAFSVTATWFVMKAIQELRASRASVILGGLLHATCVLSLAYAQEARMYAFFEMWMAISVYYFLRLYAGRGGLWLYSLACIGMALTQYLGILPVMLELAFLIFGARTLTRPQRLLLAGMFLILFGVQGQIYSTFFKWDGLSWQTMKSLAEPFALWPKDVLYELGNNSLISGAVLAIATVIGAWDLVSEPKLEQQSKLGLLALVILPILVLWATSVASGRVLLIPRYLIFIVPPFCVFLGATRFRPKSMAALLAGIFVIGSVVGLQRYFSQLKEPWRDVAAIIQRYPHSVVYTTRTLALRTPYFSRMGVDVKRLVLGDSGDLAELTADVARGEKVWILENFWGGYPYMTELKRVFSGMKFSVSELSVRDEDSPPIFVLEVERRPS